MMIGAGLSLIFLLIVIIVTTSFLPSSTSDTPTPLTLASDQRVLFAQNRTERGWLEIAFSKLLAI